MNEQLLREAVTHLVAKGKGRGLSVAALGYGILDLANQDKYFATLATLFRTPQELLTGEANFTWNDLRNLLRELVSENKLFMYEPLTVAPQPIVIYTDIRPH